MTPESIVAHYGWFALAPAVLTIALALWSKRVIESLLAGICISAAILDFHQNSFGHALLYLLPNTFTAIAGHPATETLTGIGMVKNGGRGELLLSIILLGSFITVLDKSGGAFNFANRAAKRIKGEVGALMTAFTISLSIFTSAYFSILVTGTIMKPIFDRMKISREKLAYYCDGMSAPTKAFVPFSGWIAYMAILMEENIPSVGAGNGIQGFIKSMPYNVYCWGGILFVLLLSLKIIPDFGPMKEAEQRVKKEGLLHKLGSKPMMDPKAEEAAREMNRNGTASDMFFPLAVSVLSLLILGMWNGYIVKWFPGLPQTTLESVQIMVLAFTLGILAAMIKYVSKGLMKFTEFMDHTIEGGKAALIGAMIITLAITLGDVMKATPPEGLGTASFLVETVRPYIVASWIPAITFLVGAVISFATGTSWGTWAIMMPVSVPLAIASGMNPFVVAGAVLSGGAFGDHCSPISDTTVLSSIAANTDHLQHVRTQVPYAIVVAGFAFIFYIFLGFTIS